MRSPSDSGRRHDGSGTEETTQISSRLECIHPCGGPIESRGEPQALRIRLFPEPFDRFRAVSWKQYVCIFLEIAVERRLTTNGVVMVKDTITLTLKGLSVDSGHVRLHELIRQLDSLRKALRNKERLLTGEENKRVYYRVIKVKMNSPIAITVQAVPSKPDEFTIAHNTVNGFFSDLDYIRKHKSPPPKIDLPTIESYQELGVLEGKSIEQVIIQNGKRKFLLDSKFEERITQAIGEDRIEYGSVSGTLDMINIHKTRKFYVYPLLGARKIECTFNDDLLPKVREALDKRVEVLGKLKYKQWEDFPYAITATDLVELKDDKNLAKFTDLIGADPNAGGDLSVSEYLKKMHDEEW